MSPGPADAPGARPTALTERVRELYENSVVPVREIARLAGVSERTLYKYVQRGGWRRRHLSLARDAVVAAANRGRALTPAPGFVAVKGAGGRFVAREDAGKPFPCGLKALDPAGAAQAAGACDRAAALSGEAVAQAQAAANGRAAQIKAEREAAAHLRTLELLTRSLVALAQHRAECGPRRSAGRDPAAAERADRLDAMLEDALFHQLDRLLEKTDASRV